MRGLGLKQQSINGHMEISLKMDAAPEQCLFCLHATQVKKQDFTHKFHALGGGTPVSLILIFNGTSF